MARKFKPSPRSKKPAKAQPKKRSLPPGSGTEAWPSWWRGEILGPYPGFWTQDEIWRMAQLLTYYGIQIA